MSGEGEVKVLTAREATERLLAQNDRANATKNRLIAVIGTVVIGMLGAFMGLYLTQTNVERAHVLALLRGHSSEIASEQRILRDVEAEVDPGSAYQRAEAADVARIIRLVEVCIENHSSRVADFDHHLPVPPTPPGCPENAP